MTDYHNDRCPDCGAFVGEPDHECVDNQHCDLCGVLVPPGETVCQDGCVTGSRYHRPVSREDIIEDIHRLADTLGRPPTTDEYRKHGTHGLKTAKVRFGRWSAAVKAAGYTPAKRYNIPETELIADLQLVAEQLGHTPSMDDYDEHGEFNSSTPQDRFGSWNDAIEAAGLTPNDTPGRRPAIAYLDPEDVGLSPMMSND